MIRFIFILMLFWSSLLNAEAVPANGLVLIVDVKHILDESKAAVAAQKKIEVQRSAFQDEISAKEKNIRDAEQELLQQRGKLEASEYAKKEDALRQKFRDVEKYVQERRRALEKATTSSMGKVHDVLLDIVKDIAKKRGAQVVLAKQSYLSVLWVANGNDITNEVTARLNTQLPEIPVDIDLVAPKKDGTK